MAEVWEALYTLLRAALEVHDEFTIVDDAPADIYLKEVVEHLFTPLSKLDATVAPTVNDDSADGYSIGSHWYDLTAKRAYVCLDATVGAAIWVEVTVAGGATDYVCVVDEKSDGTHGGSFSSGLWRTRTLNVERADTGNIAALASNRVTLPAGTYRCYASAPAYKVNSHQIRLRNITGSATLLVGSVERTESTQFTGNRSVLAGLFTLGVSSALEVQHRCSTTANTTGYGEGTSGTFGEVGVFTIAEFWKRA